jgi:hypothetical protein
MICFHGKELLAHRPTTIMEDYFLSAVRDCLLNMFADTLDIWKPFLHSQPEDAQCRDDSAVNRLTPELNPSAQRCLSRFFNGDFNC